MYFALFNNYFSYKKNKNAYMKWVSKGKGDLYDGSKPRIKKELKSRHIFMIALGGVIGTGLFRIGVYNS